MDTTLYYSEKDSPVSSGKLESSICFTEARIDSAPLLSVTPQFQSLDLMTTPTSIYDATSSLDATLYFIEREPPVPSGNLGNSICFAEARKDAAPFLRLFSQLQSSVHGNFSLNSLYNEDVTATAITGKKAGCICLVEASGNTAPNQSISQLQTSPHGETAAVSLDYRIDDHDNRRSSNFTAYFQNVRGLKSKLTDLLIASTGCGYDIIVLVETWLDSTINSLQLFGHEFDVYRCDRSPHNSFKRHGGGTLIAVRKKYASDLILADEYISLEQV